MADPVVYQPWIPIERIKSALQPEPAFLILSLVATSWLLYRFLLKEISPERHKNLRKLFRNLLLHALMASAMLSAYWMLDNVLQPGERWFRMVPNVGLIALVWNAIVFVKVFRIMVFEYLFFMNMRTGVPVLIVNLLTLLLSLLLVAWILAGVFNFHLAPLLATSAIFSIVVGLALQDTLGNLVAGVALQLDKPYSIGDWIEVSNGMTKYVGQVREISWRAVNLIGFTEETITIPNRVVAQAEVSNWSGKDRPFLRSQIYRIPYGQPLSKVREILLTTVAEVPGVRKIPAPLVLFLESTESWMQIKLVYSLQDYGGQYLMADQINTKVIEALAMGGVSLASQRLELVQKS